MGRIATTSQTVGPYFSIGLSPLYRGVLYPEDAGERIQIRGRVLDGDGVGVPDAVLEFWQANGKGCYAGSAEAEGSSREACAGFGRVPTSENGEFQLDTVKPGLVEAPDGTSQAPHIVVSIFMRGLLTRLITRIYFAGEALNETDFVLKQVDAERRARLVAKSTGSGNRFEWNVQLQGPQETVFFEF